MPAPPTDDYADALLDRFEAEWLAGRRPVVADYLAQAPADARDRVFEELVGLDVAYRRRLGENADVAEYATDGRLSPEAVGRVAGWVERSAPDPTPDVIGRYRVLDRLAAGGQAVAYLAHHPTLRQSVVIKLARDAAAAGGPALAAREGAILAELDHPNLVRVLDVDVHAGRVFLVLENVAGRPLDEFARTEKPDARRAAELVAGAAAGVGAAHARGISHLDLKPGNILVDPTGRPRVIDFGLARHAGWRSGSPLPALGGTPAYLAPEQARGDADALGPRTDVFGLGGVLYFLLTGAAPFAAADGAAAADRAAAGDLDVRPLHRPGVPPALRAICRTALSPDPGARYANGAELAAALGRFAAPPARGWRRTAAGLLALLAASVGGGWVVARLTAPAAPPNPAGLQVEIFRDDPVPKPVSRALPVKAGDEVHVRTHVPRRTHVSVYLVNGAGVLTLLAKYSAADIDREEVFPAPGMRAPLTGPAGTEFLIACGRAGGPVPDAEVRRQWEAGGDWPALPPATAVRVRPDRVEWDGERPRDLGPARGGPAPAERVRRRLEEFRAGLQQAGVGVGEGVAFGRP